ncbi:H/ACA ribonucleoprotein complex subunit 2-like protein isoform X1 [Scophthalmus maximus]|uniref:H/ACA ribonucleoprotein complex subunit 2-like protein isoform X1 n=1 Tax=Scophthalmus maximus TaxID=52904 RepID=UPI0015E1281D|nr:H/ACA ribonucleoprotein complex subunit 2-like protein isoform X1 [Scophthalmus maximus]
MTKVKKEKVAAADPEEAAAAGGNEKSYQELVANVNPISQPLASRKLSKKLYKCVKKGERAGHVSTHGRLRSEVWEESRDSSDPFVIRAAKVKNIRRGVKEVQKFINKGEKGIVVMAGDTLPIDVYCHLPVMCEDRSLPYAYIPSKVDLGSSAGSKRPTCVILIKPHQDYQDAYDECVEEVSNLPKPL